MEKSKFDLELESLENKVKGLKAKKEYLDKKEKLLSEKKELEWKTSKMGRFINFLFAKKKEEELNTEDEWIGGKL